jgi:hypothetical protein
MVCSELHLKHSGHGALFLPCILISHRLGANGYASRFRATEIILRCSQTKLSDRDPSSIVLSMQRIKLVPIHPPDQTQSFALLLLGRNLPRETPLQS